MVELFLVVHDGIFIGCIDMENMADMLKRFAQDLLNLNVDLIAIVIWPNSDLELWAFDELVLLVENENSYVRLTAV